MRKIIMAICAVGVAALGLTAAGTASANDYSVTETGTTTRTCHDTGGNGFTGSLWYAWAKNSVTGQVTYIGQIKYKIDKGDHAGGNNADVTYNDTTTSANPDFATTNGIQDNQWHLLGGDYYRSGGGAVGAHFVFDWSLHNDPECGVYIPLP